MKKSHAWAILGIAAIQPVANFSATNILDAEFNIVRCLFYFLAIFAFNIILFRVLTTIFKKVNQWSLLLSVVLFQLLLFNNIHLNELAQSLLGSHYRVRNFIYLDIAIICLLPLLAVLLSKKADLRKGLILFVGVFSLVDMISVMNHGLFQAGDSNNKLAVNTGSNNQIKHTQFTTSQSRNVYLIVPDMFIGPEMFKQLSGYEPEYVNWLEDNQFKVIKQAYANAPVTGFSLPHVYQMDYFLDTLDSVDSKTMNWINKIKNGDNKVIQTFHENGYDFVRFADGYVSFCNGQEDVCLKKTALLNLQDVTFLGRTAIPYIIFNYFNKIRAPIPLAFTFPEAQELEAFLSQMPKTHDKPFFALIHVGLPHPPLRFDENCTPYNGDMAFHAETNETEQFRVYAKQALCAGKKLVQFTNKILERDPEAIIVVQADHGTMTHEQSFIPIEEMTDLQLEENFNILAAYHLPSECQKYVYDGISPVNTFKVIFGCLSDKEPELLPDRHFAIYYLNSISSKEGQFKEWFPHKTALHN